MLVHEYLTQNLKLVQYLAGSTHDAAQWIFGEVDLHLGASRQQVGQARQQGTTASQGDPARHHVRDQLRRCLFDRIRDGINNGIDGDSNRFANLVTADFELGRQTSHEITSAHDHALIGRATIQAIVRVTGRDFYLFGHAFTDEQVVSLACVLRNIGVHLVAGDANRPRHDDSAQRDHRHFCRTTADVDDHAAGGFGYR